ncbi:hypothetical protein ACET3X_005695 [Alternaria dauci]|uniref:MYND-type domain-containing protein n=1 Tax=Alternaria dauci TaxID=48095 RepID=A0ABR3UIX1_9PLEO
MAPEAQPVCVVCGEPAPNKCRGCKSDASSRRYCGKVCQEKDWPAHKKACRDIQNANLEKKLARVAEILQQGYYDFRKNTWDTPLIKVQRLGNDDLVIYEGIKLGGGRTKYFMEFPQHLVSDTRTENAVLCSLVCNEPSAWMHSIISELMEDLDVDIEEVSMDLNSPPHKIIFHYINGESDQNDSAYPHQTIRVTSTKTKKAWIIDISGARYGICQALWTWKEYRSRFMAEVHLIYPLGTNKAAVKMLSEIPGLPTLDFGVMGKVADHLASKVNIDWQSAFNLSLSQLVALDEEKFKKGKLELLGFMNSVVRTFVRNNEFRAEYKATVAYEDKNPGVSGQRVNECTDAFFAKVARSKTV